jgi:CDP-diacylglycerol---serine O-phosphatidyltransferase
MKRHIPNFITSLNLACGCIGIGIIFKGDLITSAYLIGLAAIFDLLDGISARLLNSRSDFGKELDSLADIVSFGVLPGLIFYCLLDMAFYEAEGIQGYIPFIAFLIPVFSALRLAKFNNDSNQANSFSGMPTPANALFIASIPLILVSQDNKIPFIYDIFGNPGFIIILVFALSLLMVLPIPLFSLKFKDLSWKNNIMQYILIISSIILLIFLNFYAVPIIFFLYIILSIINNSLKK